MVSLTHEERLLQEIGDLAAKGKIQSSVVGLTKQAAKSKIEKLIPTTKQRINAAKFYLDLIERMDSDFYLAIQASPPIESQTVSPLKPFIDFSDDDSVHVQIKLLKNNNSTLREKSALIVFIVLNGFFSNLVGSEDCVVRIINTIYDLVPDNRSSFQIRQKLEQKAGRAHLARHLRNFHAIDRNGIQNKKGSSFAIATTIRNQLTHDDIEDVMISSSSISLSGLSPEHKLRFHPRFFPDDTVSVNTEIIAFCQSVFKETVDFVDECYRLIERKLQRSGSLPV